MKKTLLTIFAVTCLFTVGCQDATEVGKEANKANSNQVEVKKLANDYSAELKTSLPDIKAGEQVDLIFTLKNPNGEVVKDLQIVHEKPLHLLIVSEDLAEFYHEHPEPQSDGSLKVPFTFKNAGKFKLYLDFTPKDEKQMVKTISLSVSGVERAREELKVDEKLEKRVDSLMVTMKTSGVVSSGKETMIDFQVFDAQTKKPVTDLENYLGEKAHFVVISQDLKDFVHAHPMSRDNAKDGHSHGADSQHKSDEKLAGVDAESIVSAHLAFPQPGIYKIFAQFKRGGKITTVPFVIKVQESDGKADSLKPVTVPNDAVKVVVDKNGYTPSEITLTKGKFNRIAFYRADAENCGGEVVFKSLNLTKKLPVGEIVLVDLPKDFSGTLEFNCGMNMYKGKIVVE